MEKNSSLSWKDFQLVKKLGKGSFGDVHLIKRLIDDHLLAMKSVQMDRLTPSEKDGALNQVRLLASIKTPYVVSYEGSFYSSVTNSLCLVMEYCQEGDLENIIKKELILEKGRKKIGLNQDFVWKTLIDILKGLKILHKNKIAHRDLKSANIFYSQGVAKLGDLNVSCVADSTFYKTKTGTPYYTAPEIWKGDDYTCNCDIWSLGCIIYEMCALRPPFKAHNFPDLFVKIARGQYEPLSENYSDSLRTIIRLCLQIDPSERVSAEDLLESKFVLQKLQELKYKDSQGQVNLIQKIRCPKVLKYLNDHLPAKQQLEIRSKKKIRIVQFENQKFQDKQNNHQFKIRSTKTRSEKIIKHSPQKSTAKLNIYEKSSKKTIKSMKKLPPLNNSKSKEKDRDTSKDKSLKASTKNMKFRSQKRIQGKSFNF